MANLTATELSVIDALVAHNAARDTVTLSHLAEECNVAKSTVVKAIQKLGFSGFTDYTTAYNIHASSRRDAVFPRKVVDGSFTQVARELAESFVHGVGRKNLIFPHDRLSGQALSSYLSRKLSMFELFCPASYDYLMIDVHQADPGVLYFFFRELRSDEKTRGAAEETYRHYTDYAHTFGYRIVTFTDVPERITGPNAGTIIPIAPTTEPFCDLFSAKVIMVFEHALSIYSKHLRERPHG